MTLQFRRDKDLAVRKIVTNGALTHGYARVTDARYRGRFTNMRTNLVEDIIKALEAKHVVDASITLQKYASNMLDFSFSVSTLVRGVANVTFKIFDIFEDSLPYKVMVTLLSLSIFARHNLSKEQYLMWHHMVCEIAQKCNKKMSLPRVGVVFGVAAFLAARKIGKVKENVNHLQELDTETQILEATVTTFVGLVAATWAYIYTGAAGTFLKRLFNKTRYDTLVATLIKLPEEDDPEMPQELLSSIPYPQLRSLLS